MTTSRVLVCATGAASVLQLPAYLISLRSQARVGVTVAMSAAATRFVTPAAIDHIVDEVVDGSDPRDAFRSGHMRLALGADLVVVLPATANTIANVARGAACDLISATVLGSTCPTYFFPSMNRVMWEKPAVQRNVAQLREDGHLVPEPVYQRGFELADRSFGEHPTLPGIGEVVDIVRAALRGTVT